LPRAESEVRSTDEASLVDTAYRANLDTLTAACAKTVIYNSEVILYCDCTVGTGLLTLHTTDTTVGACLSGYRAFIVIRALYYYTGGIVYEMNYAVGTFSYADSAADTFSRINSRHTVLDGYSILWAYSHTVTVAEAGEITESVTAVRHIGGAAGLLTLIVVFFSYYVAGAVASNESDLFNNVCRLNTEDGSNILCSFVTARHTEICSLGVFVCESLCIAVTARIAASTAVCTRKAVADSQSGFVFFNCKEDGCNGKKNSTNKSNTEKKKYRE